MSQCDSFTANDGKSLPLSASPSSSPTNNPQVVGQLVAFCCLVLVLFLNLEQGLALLARAGMVVKAQV